MFNMRPFQSFFDVLRLCFSCWTSIALHGGDDMTTHKHWEVDSICPKCEKVNKVVVPEGELVVLVQCMHCEHGYQYTHVVRDHTEVED